MRLPSRNSDLVNLKMRERSGEIPPLMPDIGSAAEAQLMAATVGYNLRTLAWHDIGSMHHQYCHSCGLSSFAAQDSKTHVCGYCGHGPFGPGWCSNATCSESMTTGRQLAAADAPGADTWWVVQHAESCPFLQLYCGSCVALIPAFLNHYQSQLLDPTPDKWADGKCGGCAKELIIVVDVIIADDSWAGVSQAVQP